jgi:hypothetical protein
MSTRNANCNSNTLAAMAWWRTLPADEFELRDVAHLRRCMQGLQILGEPGWSDAARGDAAEAIGIAVRLTIKQPCIEPIVDLVMTAVLGAAIEGNGAAQHFLAHMVGRREAADPLAESVATSWIAVSHKAALSRCTSKPHVRMRPRQRCRIASCGGSARRR